MANMCKVQVIGRAVGDAEQRYSQQGTMMVSFRMAVNTYRRNPDGTFAEDTMWFRVTTFGRMAEQCMQSVAKGKNVYVDGRLRTSIYTSRDGEARVGLDITSDNVVMLDPRERTEDYDPDMPAGAPARPAASGAPGRSAPSSGPSEPSDLEDLPF